MTGIPKVSRYDPKAIGSCNGCGRSNYKLVGDALKMTGVELLDLTIGVTRLRLCQGCAVNAATTLEAAIILLKQGNIKLLEVT